eukprot:COSAG05_NODE_3767_length_1847_cov_1.614416_2_plen_74_part_00
MQEGESVARQRAEAELVVVQEQSAALQTQNLRLHQDAMAAEEAVEENQGLRERVAQMQARIRELEQQQQVRST